MEGDCQRATSQKNGISHGVSLKKSEVSGQLGDKRSVRHKKKKLSTAEEQFLKCVSLRKNPPET